MGPEMFIPSLALSAAAPPAAKPAPKPAPKAKVTPAAKPKGKFADAFAAPSDPAPETLRDLMKDPQMAPRFRGQEPPGKVQAAPAVDADGNPTAEAAPVISPEHQRVLDDAEKELELPGDIDRLLALINSAGSPADEELRAKFDAYLDDKLPSERNPDKDLVRKVVAGVSDDWLETAEDFFMDKFMKLNTDTILYLQGLSGTGTEQLRYKRLYKRTFVNTVRKVGQYVADNPGVLDTALPEKTYAFHFLRLLQSSDINGLADAASILAEAEFCKCDYSTKTFAQYQTFLQGKGIAIPAGGWPSAVGDNVVARFKPRPVYRAWDPRGWRQAITGISLSGMLSSVVSSKANTIDQEIMK